jgi:hypothetical protein
MSVGGVDCLSLVDYLLAITSTKGESEERGHTVHHSKEGTDTASTGWSGTTTTVRSIVLSSTGYSKVTSLVLSLERLLLLSTVSTWDVVGLLSAVALVLVVLVLLLLVMVSRD